MEQSGKALFSIELFLGICELRLSQSQWLGQATIRGYRYSDIWECELKPELQSYQAAS